MHQFSDEYAVFYKDGRRAEKTYYCVNIKPEVKGFVIWEKSKIPSIKHISGHEDEMLFDEAMIGGLHLWRAPDLGRVCMSDSLYKAIKKAKIKDFSFQHELMGNR